MEIFAKRTLYWILISSLVAYTTYADTTTTTSVAPAASPITTTTTASPGQTTTKMTGTGSPTTTGSETGSGGTDSGSSRGTSAAGEMIILGLAATATAGIYTTRMSKMHQVLKI